jgi:membrane-associated phospholipid phosphatase
MGAGSHAFGQSSFPYELKGSVDYPLLGAGLLTTGFSYYLDRRTPALREAELDLLRIADIPGIDRHVTRYYSLKAHQFSNVTALASIVAPFALYLDRNNRQDGNGGKLLLITLQGALLNAGLINLTKTAVRRPRPFVFNGDAPLELKLRQDARYSFFSGHTAVSSFFAFTGAQLYHDLYPDSRSRGIVWASAAVLPLLTGYGRMRAGKHFVTDILVGYGVGALIGVLVPRLHRL